VNAPLFASAVALAVLATACSKDSRAATRPSGDPGAAPSAADCSHSACGHDFFIDAAPSAGCAVGATCTVSLTLVATGAFHINDEYPYKFRADDAAGVQFLGSGSAGKNVFSKDVGDWRKKDEKTGTMTVRFRPTAAGGKTIGGVFKLSVCSEQSCQLEQQQVSTSVVVK